MKAMTTSANPLLGYRVLTWGIVDRDFHFGDYFDALNGVFPIEVAEVENFFCTDEVVRAVAVWSGTHTPPRRGL